MDKNFKIIAIVVQKQLQLPNHKTKNLIFLNINKINY